MEKWRAAPFGAARFVWGDTFLLWGIHLSPIVVFTFGNIAPIVLAMFTFGNIAVRTARRPDYSKYWNLLVEKANVTTKPSPGSDAAVTSMPILEHRRATR